MWSFVKLLVWGLLYIPAWVLTHTIRHFQRKPHQDNCLSWSLRKWNAHGGYLVIRWSRNNRLPFIRWPHFLWLPPTAHHDLRHYVPKHGASPHIVPSPFFDGRVQQGDPITTKEN